MSKVIQFPKQNKKISKQVRTLKKISDSIDEIVINALVEEEVDPHELAGLLAHRLGALLKGFEDKDKTWDVCQKVARKQAVIDEAN